MKKHDVLSLYTSLTLLAILAATRVAAGGTDTWTGSVNANWSNAGNWTGDNAPPEPGDTLQFSSSSFTTLNDDLAAGTVFYGLTFLGGSAFTLNGNAILLSGSTNGNTVGIANGSGMAQTIGTMPLALDRGYYTFSSPLGGSIALNGGLTLSPGGVAYFDPAVTSTALTADGTTGLIHGLQGAGLIYNGTAPTDLATIGSGAISAYAGYTDVASGALSSGNNIRLTASGAAAAYTASGITVNTIRAVQVGNSGGTATDTLTTTGTLTLGDKGGVYVLDSGAGNKACLNLAGGTITAGSGSAATLVFGVNGTTTGNQLAVNSTIADNGAGPVTIETVGNGSLYFAVANTYTGGTYVNQGQLQGNNIGSFGSGAIYIAGGATMLLNQAGTWANNFFLSPGSGAAITGAGTAGAGSLEVNNNDTFSGTITLQGSPVTVAPGDRITPNITGGTETFTGQITGTGTLEFFGFHSYTAVLRNTSAVNPNNWQGGMIIGGKVGVAVNVLVKMGATSQIPNGPNAGNVIFLPAEASGNANARFDLGGFDTTVNGLDGTSPNSQTEAQLLNSGSTNCTLTFGANDATAQFYGTVSDGGIGKATTLNKIGLGNQAFNNTMTHFGNTIVTAGTLTLMGSSNPSNSPVISVASGAILDGSLLGIGGLAVGPAQSLVGRGTVMGSTMINGTVTPFLAAIGTLTNNGTLSFNGGGSYVWDINNATGAAGTDSGWGLLKVVGGGLAINANSGSPFTIKVTSLAAGDVPGAAANFNRNASGSWTIVQADSPISGFDVSAFRVDTSAFANLPGSTAFSLGLSEDQLRLVLFYTPNPVVSTPLTNQINCAGSSASFTVVANGATTPINFQWQQGSTVLADGGTTASGASVTITVNGHTSTLALGGSGVEDADAGGYTVSVTGNSGEAASSAATLTVIDPPSSPSLTQTPSATMSAGGVTYFAATAGGTAPFTYAWSRNGTPLVDGGPISGSSTATLAVDISPATIGSYAVVVGNPCGSASSSPSAIGPVTSVPGQVIYETFDSYVPQVFRPTSDTWEGVTNLFNEQTDEPAWWYHASGSGIQMIVQLNDIGDGVNNQNGGSYPWPGLAGTSTNCLYWNESLNSHLEFAQSGFTTGTTVYVSFILDCTSLGSADSVEDCIAAFCSPNDSTSYNWKLCTQITDYVNGQYLLGLSKGNGRTGSQGVDANTIWASTPTEINQALLIVGAYTINSGGTSATDDTVSLWINPDAATFGSAAAPAPTLGPTNFGVANSAIRDFSVHCVVAPASHRLADLRIGTTWASVTPSARPSLTLANLSVDPGATAVFASQNSGNPATGYPYQWQFNGGSPLSDNSHVTGTDTPTLTIANVQEADAGTYTVTATNLDPITSALLTGSASATLTVNPPKLHLTLNSPNLILSWPTNWTGYILEGSPRLTPAGWTTNSLPPYPLDGTHTNYAVSVSAASGTQFFRLKK